MEPWLAWLADSDLQRSENEGGRNYWDVYLEEILDLLGTPGHRIEVADVRIDALAAYQTVMIGSLGWTPAPASLSQTLHEWVRKGGLLFAFGTRGLDEWLGLQVDRELYQTDDYARCADLWWDGGSPNAAGLRAPG